MKGYWISGLLSLSVFIIFSGVHARAGGPSYGSIHSIPIIEITPGSISREAKRGRLMSRPKRHRVISPLNSGLYRFHVVNQTRGGYLFVPLRAQELERKPLIVMFHGAGGIAEHTLNLLQDWSNATGTVLVLPETRGPRTWDIISNKTYGPDIAFTDQLLEYVFSRIKIDSRRLAVFGFSDGASYALSVGMMNGSLFSHVVAFSPGFAKPLRIEGSPQIFVSHGIEDPVLPVDECSRRIVPRLRRQNLNVRYVEFHGEHTVPPYILNLAMEFFLIPMDYSPIQSQESQSQQRQVVAPED